jgi:nicotinate-nucleotide adenylyltransferase
MVKKIGLYFGSFNPIHNGHIAFGNFFVENTDLHEVMFIVCPLNPFKTKEELLGQKHRLNMVQQALLKFPKLICSNVEFTLPKPNYTIETLKHLISCQSNVSFSLLIGEDNLVNFNKWKEYKNILKLVDLYVYPRKHRNKIPKHLLKHSKINLLDAPKLDFASSDIRKKLKKGEVIKSSIPTSTMAYLEKNNIYK